jgi:hypothetical protein
LDLLHALNVTHFNCISSDVLVPLIGWHSRQLPGWLPLNLALIRIIADKLVNEAPYKDYINM